MDRGKPETKSSRPTKDECDKVRNSHRADVRNCTLRSERWNEEIGGRLENVEALFIQMVGRVATERCDYCLAGRGIFLLCVVFNIYECEREAGLAHIASTSNSESNIALLKTRCRPSILEPTDPGAFQ
ncbi:Protein of unknown function DUF3716 [Penicillium camemberti]|uniref:Uncharacterized protein n=1 Tax=Penicillium camemberti (strain FM 013) TaxID=1429867 RepID=A0A0G4P332_PENC3|nr:Protein of unknown function DUF3716 [Penicillium camemberti]